MPRGKRKEVVYTGRAAEVNKKVLKLQAELKAAKEELKAAYKEQLKAEKIAAAKADKEAQEKLLKVIKDSGKTPEEILALLSQK